MKKFIKSIVALLAAASLTVGFCACDLFGGSSSGETPPEVLCRADITVIFIRDPKATEDEFN